MTVPSRLIDAGQAGGLYYIVVIHHALSPLENSGSPGYSAPRLMLPLHELRKYYDSP